MASRKRFERAANGILVDRTNPRRTVFIHPPSADDTTDAVMAKIEAGEYGIAPLLSKANLARVRPALHAAAKREKVLPPNLAQALALIGGPAEVRVLLATLTASPIIDDRQEQIRIAMLAEAIVSVRPSRRAARALVEIVRVGVPSAVQHAGSRISLRLLADPPLPVRRVLERAIPLLMKGDDEVFAMAFPILFRSHFHEACARARRVLASAATPTRSILIGRLTECGYYGLPLLLEAFRDETELDLRLSLARSIAPALDPKTLGALIAEALTQPSPSLRETGTRLLRHLPPRVARRLAQRRDPEPRIDAELASFR